MSQGILHLALTGNVHLELEYRAARTEPYVPSSDAVEDELLRVHAQTHDEFACMLQVLCASEETDDTRGVSFTGIPATH